MAAFLDAPDKVNGRAKFGIDVMLRKMKFAEIAISPVFGGKPKSMNESAALAIRGVHQVVFIDSAVAVVGDNTWAAKKGLKAAEVQWDEGPNAGVRAPIMPL